MIDRVKAGLLVTALWRPAWIRGLVDLPVFAAVSALVIFFISLPMKAPIDSIVYELGSGYEQSASTDIEASVHGGTSVIALTGFPVAPVPGPGQTLAYTPDLVHLELQIPQTFNAYKALVAGDIVSDGGVEGALIDVDSALHLGVAQGDDVVLLVPNVTDQAAITIHIAGLLRPAPARTDSSVGLLVVPASELPAAFLAEAGSSAEWTSVTKSLLIFDPEPAAPYLTTSRADAIWQDVLTIVNPLRLAGLIGVFACAIGLWGAVALRSFGNVLGNLRARAAILTALGAPPRSVSRAEVLPEVLLAVFGCVSGGIVVQNALFPLILRRSLQGAALLPGLVLVFGMLWVVAVLAIRRARAALGSQSVVNTLAAEEIG
jgi:hypothetical protein